MGSKELAIQVNHLNYAFQDKKVLEDITLNLEADKIYGLLGKNGMGKTTLINVLVNQLVAAEGEIKLFGKDPRKSPEILGEVCVVRETEFYAPYMKVKSIFELYGSFYPFYDKELEQKLVALFKLPLHKSYQKYSRGMKTLVFDIIGICSGARLTIFDEPTLGLDAETREQFYNLLIEEYAKNPRTIIISTHLIDEVERLLEHLVILHKGKILLEEEVETFKEKAYYLSGHKEDLEKLHALEGRTPKEYFGKSCVYSYWGELDEVDRQQIKALGIEVGKMSVQKAFIELTKEE